MRIVQVTAEFSPLAKAGGLGEMVLGLSRELGKINQQVEIILPKYDFIDSSKLKNIKLELPDFKSTVYENQYANAMWSADYEECSLHLLETRHPAGYLQRDKIYGYEDDTARFLYFSLAILEYLKIKQESIDVLHIHDWHFALVAILARDHFHLPVKKIVLTIHSAEYQGKCATWDFDAIGLKGIDYLKPNKLQDDDPNYPETLNLLKGAIVYADALTTVSPSYAREFLTKKMGFHIDATLRKYKQKLTPIINGIDQKFWDPNQDPFLLAHYGADSSFEKITQGKQAERELLKTRFSLQDKRPWIGAVTRLVAQKGPELIEEAIHQTVRLGGTFILIGSSPSPDIQAHFEALRDQYANHPQVALHLDYNEELAHQIYAALDFLIIPSHFEPCGLTQLIAMRYGTIPIAHATGGLKDTIIDCRDFTVPIKNRNGFLFLEPTKEAMNQTIERAFEIFEQEPSLIQLLIRSGMQFNSSWKKPAQKYLKLYKEFTFRQEPIPVPPQASSAFLM